MPPIWLDERDRKLLKSKSILLLLVIQSVCPTDCVSNCFALS